MEILRGCQGRGADNKPGIFTRVLGEFLQPNLILSWKHTPVPMGSPSLTNPNIAMS